VECCTDFQVARYHHQVDEIMENIKVNLHLGSLSTPKAIPTNGRQLAPLSPPSAAHCPSL